MEITETGENLDVVILTSTADDWRAFGTWYSIYKNWPDAKIVMSCVRNNKIEFQYYQWAKRLNLPIFYTKKIYDDPYLHYLQIYRESKRFVRDKVLLLPTDMMVIDMLDEKLLELMNNKDNSTSIDNNIWYFNEVSVLEAKDMMDDIGLSDQPLAGKYQPVSLYKEAKESVELSPIVSYIKGCGRWIHTMQGCPFSSASGFITDDMTVNERRIIELWRKMVSLYSVVL